MVRPLDALESHVALIRALRNPRNGNVMWSSLNQRSNSGGNGLYGSPDGYAYLLDRAATIVVTDRMLSAILERMPDVEFGQPLHREDLMFSAGYVVLPRPVEVPNDDADVSQRFYDENGDEMSNSRPKEYVAFDAGTWVPSQVATAEMTPDERLLADVFGDPPGIQGITYGQLVSRGLGLQIARTYEVAEDLPTLDEVESAYDRYRIQHLPIYVAGWGFGLSWNPMLREHDYVLSAAGEFERRFWLSLWSTLQEETVAPVHFRRGDARRNARLRSQLPEVVVADLRRIKHRHREEPTDDGAVIMWSHRWKVRGHTRTLNRGMPNERVVHVKEYVKGPSHLPLIEKDQVYRLMR